MAVRRESVELSLSDAGFTTGMAKAAAMTALLNKELGNVDNTSVKADRSTRQLADGGIKKTGTSARQSSDDLNKYTGRLNALVSAAVTVGPALIPVTAGLIPGITGMAAGLGAAAGAAGVAVLAFHGIGDAVTALDKYRLEPTAAHLQALNEKMAALGPAGQNFTRFLDDLEPRLHSLQATAQAGLLPGVQTGLEALLPLLPQVRELIASISTEMGSLAGKAGAGLASDPEFVAFFHYLQTDAAPTLDAFAKATGNVGAALAQMTVDFAPVNRDFADGLVHASESFRQWADGLAQTQGFRDFVAYMETNGPKTVQLIGSIGSALLGVAQAAAPVGAVVLPILTDLLRIIGAIGKSPLGPVIYTGVAATIAFNKGAQAMSGLLARLTGQTAALSLEMRGLAASAGAADVALAGGGAAGVAKITGLGSLLAASPVVRGLPGKAAGALSTTATTALIAYLAGHAANAGFNAVGPKPGEFDVNSIVDSIHKTTGFEGAATKPLYPITNLLGFNPEHFNDKSPYKNADQGLAQMVNSGDGEKAAAIFDKVNSKVKDAAKYFPNYTTAVNAAKIANGGLTDAQVKSRDASLKQAAALKATVDAALGAFDAETNYRQALAAATEQAKKSNAGFKGNSAEVLANRQALSGLAGVWNQQIQAMAANGASADKIRAKYAAARQELINTATGMGATAAQARQYAHQLLQTPKSITTQFTVSVDTGSLGALEDRLARLAGKHTKTYVDVIQQGLTGKQIALQQKAQGGHITGPGTSTSDSIPAYLSNGEYVMRAAAVQRYGTHMFDSLNAMHFATGGLASRTIVPLTNPYATAKDYGVSVDRDGRLQKQLNEFSSALKQATTSLSNETQARDSLVSTITGNLTAGDLFGGSGGSVFGQQYAAGSIGSVNAKLAQQIKDANDQTALEKSLAGRGVSGPALQALIEQGGVSGLRSASNASDSDLATYQKNFGDRAIAVGAAASTGASVLGMTQAQDKTTNQVAVLTAVVKQLQQQIAAQHKERKAQASKAPAAQAAATTKALNNTAKKGRHHR